MTLTVLAGLCGKSAAYLSMVETGKRDLNRWSSIVAVANALKIAPAELALETPPAEALPAGGSASVTARPGPRILADARGGPHE